MRATLIYGAGDIRSEIVRDPIIQRPTDALVRVVASCICGSDLWPYRGVSPTPKPRRIGHEFVGLVEEVGADVQTLRPGQFVVAPFVISDNTCPNCQRGVQTSCLNGGHWGTKDAEGFWAEGGQGEWVRVPQADGTLVGLNETPDASLVPALLSLSDVMGTGHHAALGAGVGPGSTVAVVGDGAVGLCAVLAARRLGAERVVLMSRTPARQALGTAFGADTIVTERGEEGSARIRDLFEGLGADAVLECVGTDEAMEQAVASARPGGRVGYVGAPISGKSAPIGPLFGRNVGLVGGVAPVRAYIPELLADVLAGKLDPGRVFDSTLPLAEAAAGYRAMDERTAIKVLLAP
ncbi:MAG: Threonine dehydrogenase and related Zn-dependent dehydrogenase [Frankiales bacterium]|nr:Threonine dehydrogenase and related Zn-dependent dehydrogenase [Frankiales bacterium]